MTGFTTPNSSTQQQAPIKPWVIGVSGGSGSGKTYFAKALAKELSQKRGEDVCSVIYQDHFYKDQSAKFDFDGGSVNFDHPEALDFRLFADCIENLKRGQSVRIPQYDFKTHSRQGEGVLMNPRPVLIADGTLIFHYPFVRELFDELVFIETKEDLRFSRRLDRDVRERGRTPEGVRAQFLNQVKPMHDQFVEPCSNYSGLIIRSPSDFEGVLQTCVAHALAAQKQSD